MCKLKIDHEFKNLIPPLQPDEYEALKESISKDGCRDAIVIWNCAIVDGHNRYEICNELNLIFKVVEIDFGSRDEAKLWILKNQMARRNISDYTKAQMALKCKNIIAAKARENQGTRTDFSQNSVESMKPINTQKELAKLVGISRKRMTFKITKKEVNGLIKDLSSLGASLVSVNKPRTYDLFNKRMAEVLAFERTIKSLTKKEINVVLINNGKDYAIYENYFGDKPKLIELPM